MMKLERKQKYQELKCTLKEVWTIELESDDETNDGISVPSHYRKYTLQDRWLVVQQPVRVKPNEGGSYDGPENAKQINLAKEGEEPKPAYIAADLEPKEE